MAWYSFSLDMNAVIMRKCYSYANIDLILNPPNSFHLNFLIDFIIFAYNLNEI